MYVPQTDRACRPLTNPSINQSSQPIAVHAGPTGVSVRLLRQTIVVLFVGGVCLGYKNIYCQIEDVLQSQQIVIL
ncbi:hypothetical protein B5X24_HaOG211468 [Helicoverpa armigera]|nr:hypothetical protein B5X24_HaOG211468 [Helicoverpa armigera]